MDKSLLHLVSLNLHGTTAYRFDKNAVNPRQVSYAFFSRNFDVSQSRGKAVVTLPDQTNVFLCNQVHGAHITECSEHSIEADGLFVKKGECAGIITADCTPVLMYSEKDSLGCVLHCGWKSTFEEIVSKAVLKLKRVGVSVGNINCLLGPAAQSCCYEVQKDFFDRTKELVQSYKAPLTYTCAYKRADAYFVSITEVVHMQLLDQGIPSSNIHRSLDCTICNDDFFSFRREKGAAGRQLSVLSIH